jgi:hypothetical protein
MKRDERPPLPPGSSDVDAELLERLFRYAREDHFVATRRPAVLVSLREWERYEKTR